MRPNRLLKAKVDKLEAAVPNARPIHEPSANQIRYDELDANELARLVGLLLRHTSGADLNDDDLIDMHDLCDSHRSLFDRLGDSSESAKVCGWELDHLTAEFIANKHHREWVTQGKPVIEKCLATVEMLGGIKRSDGPMIGSLTSATNLFTTALYGVFFMA